MRRRDLSKVLVASAAGSLLAETARAAPAAETARGAQGADRYPRSDAEIASGVSPRDPSHPPGSVLRYGADPTGATDSSTAWSEAIKSNSHVFDDHPGGGSYLFADEVVIARYPVTISGSAKHIGSGKGGTLLTLATAAGKGKAVLRTTGWASCVRIERMRFAWQALKADQIGLRFAELRASKILDCAFVGSHDSGTSVCGIRFDGSGTFTGDVTVRGNYFSGLLCAVDLQGTCTSIRILENEMYGYVSNGTSQAVRITPRTTETVIAFNNLEGWTTGIESSGGYIKQIANTYETNGTNFEWRRGAGNDRIWNISLGEAFVSGGDPVYPLNDRDACMVLSGPGLGTLDTMSLNARRGVYSYGRTAREGDWSSEPPSAAAYDANNFVLWNVSAPALSYTRIGHTMMVNFRVDSSRISGSRATRLFIRLPQSERAVQAAAATCFIDDGSATIGKVEIAAGSDRLSIAKLNDEAFSSGNFSCWGSLSFECS